MVGTGYLSQFHYHASTRLGVYVVGICLLKIGEARGIAATFAKCCAFNQFNVMLDTLKPEVVDIVTLPQSHMTLLKICMEHGIPFICPKPITKFSKEAEVLVSPAESAGVLIFVDENFEF